MHTAVGAASWVGATPAARDDLASPDRLQPLSSPLSSLPLRVAPIPRILVLPGSLSAGLEGTQKSTSAEPSRGSGRATPRYRKKDSPFVAFLRTDASAITVGSRIS